MRVELPPGVRAPQPRTTPVFVLSGGLGTRLRGVADGPKSLLPLAGRPFLHYLLRLLRLQGFGSTVLCLGAGAEAVQAAFAADGPLAAFASTVRFSTEPEPLGTGGALAHAAAASGRWNLILNGDSYAQADYADLLAAHRRHGPEAPRAATLLAVRVDDAATYGGLDLDAEGRVAGFHEKGRTGPGWINAGVYVAGGDLLRSLPAGRYSLEREVLPGLAAAGRLRALTGRFYFRDIGTPERLRAAREEFRWIARREEDDEG